MIQNYGARHTSTRVLLYNEGQLDGLCLRMLIALWNDHKVKQWAC
jgi:hypothetical protein